MSDRAMLSRAVGISYLDINGNKLYDYKFKSK